MVLVRNFAFDSKALYFRLSKLMNPRKSTSNVAMTDMMVRNRKGQAMNKININLTEISPKRIVVRILSVGTWEPLIGAKLKFICGNGNSKKIVDSRPHPSMINDDVKIKLGTEQR